MTKQSIRLPLAIMLTLIAIFGVLLFLSTASKNVEQSYSFKEEATITMPYSYEGGESIGTATFTNKGILPAKQQIKQFVLCDFNSSTPQTYIINYVGKTQRSNDFLFENYNKEYVEISKAETLNLHMRPEYYLRPQLENNISEEKKTFHIFEVDNPSNRYNYCVGEDPSNAMQTISITIEDENK